MKTSNATTLAAALLAALAGLIALPVLAQQSSSSSTPKVTSGATATSGASTTTTGTTTTTTGTGTSPSTSSTATPAINTPAINTGHPLDTTTGNTTVQVPTGNLTTLNPAATGGTTLNPLNVPTTLNPNVTTPPAPGTLSPTGAATTLNPDALSGAFPAATMDTLNGSPTTLNPALGTGAATTLNPGGVGTTLNPQQPLGAPGSGPGVVNPLGGVVPLGTRVGTNANGTVIGQNGAMLNTNGTATGVATGTTALVRGANGTVITNGAAGSATVRGGIGTVAAAGTTSGTARELTLSTPTSLLSDRDAHANAIAQLSNGQVVMVLDQSGDWVHVRTTDGSEGWVKLDARASGLSKSSESHLQPGGEMVLGETLDLNGKPANSGGVSERAVAGDRILVLARQGDWLQVRTPSGATGWARESDLVSLHDQIEHRLTMAKDQELHAKPAPGARVVGRVVTGVEVDILQDANGWMLVKTPQGQGWIRR